MKLTFSHRIDTNNVGDYWSCPLSYYQEYLSAHITERLEIKKIKPRIYNQTNPLIIGGGGLIGETKFDAILRSILNSHQSKLKVIWAAGDNVSKAHEPTDFLSYIFKFDLVGIRDYIKGYEQYWLPCVSCKSPLFDKYKNTNPRNEIVYFQHLYKPFNQEIIRNKPGPLMTNNGTDLESVLQFLSTGEYVITNSYHGAYWAQLLGKKVISSAWSSKFKNFRDPIVLSDPKDWYSNLTKAKSYDILEEYREHNDVFFQKFLNKL